MTLWPVSWGSNGGQESVASQPHHRNIFRTQLGNVTPRNHRTSVASCVWNMFLRLPIFSHPTSHQGKGISRAMGNQRRRAAQTSTSFVTTPFCCKEYPKNCYGQVLYSCCLPARQDSLLNGLHNMEMDSDFTSTSSIATVVSFDCWKGLLWQRLRPIHNYQCIMHHLCVPGKCK